MGGQDVTWGQFWQFTWMQLQVGLAVCVPLAVIAFIILQRKRRKPKE